MQLHEQKWTVDLFLETCESRVTSTVYYTFIPKSCIPPFHFRNCKLLTQWCRLQESAIFISFLLFLVVLLWLPSSLRKYRYSVTVKLLARIIKMGVQMWGDGLLEGAIIGNIPKIKRFSLISGHPQDAHLAKCQVTVKITFTSFILNILSISSDCAVLLNSFRSSCCVNVQNWECVVPENIHTPTTEGIGNSEGVGGVKDPGNSGGEGGLNDRFGFQMPFDSIRVQKSFLTY